MGGLLLPMNAEVDKGINPRIAAAIRAVKYGDGCPEELERHHARVRRSACAARSRLQSKSLFARATQTPRLRRRQTRCAAYNGAQNHDAALEFSAIEGRAYLGVRSEKTPRFTPPPEMPGGCDGGKARVRTAPQREWCCAHLRASVARRRVLFIRSGMGANTLSDSGRVSGAAGTHDPTIGCPRKIQD
jgi:hypothetical protein